MPIQSRVGDSKPCTIFRTMHASDMRRYINPSVISQLGWSANTAEDATPQRKSTMPWVGLWPVKRQDHETNMHWHNYLSICSADWIERVYLVLVMTEESELRSSPIKCKLKICQCGKFGGSKLHQLQCTLDQRGRRSQIVRIFNFLILTIRCRRM